MKISNKLMVVLIIGCVLNIALGINIVSKKYDAADLSAARLEGYRTQQIENLPSPGLERVKRPDPELVTKTGRG